MREFRCEFFFLGGEDKRGEVVRRRPTRPLFPPPKPHFQSLAREREIKCLSAARFSIQFGFSDDNFNRATGTPLFFSWRGNENNGGRLGSRLFSFLTFASIPTAAGRSNPYRRSRVVALLLSRCCSCSLTSSSSSGIEAAEAKAEDRARDSCEAWRSYFFVTLMREGNKMMRKKPTQQESSPYDAAADAQSNARGVGAFETFFCSHSMSKPIQNTHTARHLRAGRRKWTGRPPIGPLRFGDERFRPSWRRRRHRSRRKTIFSSPNPTRYPCPPFSIPARFEELRALQECPERKQKDRRDLRATSRLFDCLFFEGEGERERESLRGRRARFFSVLFSPCEL